jgi:hypothetical protein
MAYNSADVKDFAKHWPVNIARAKDRIRFPEKFQPSPEVQKNKA